MANLLKEDNNVFIYFTFVWHKQPKQAVSISNVITITKIFRFEAAHAIHDYPGSCANIHGHSYKLHVTVKSQQLHDDFIGGLGLVIDFKELKAIVNQHAVSLLDHKILLSKAYLLKSGNSFRNEELVVLDYEPTTENLILFLRDRIRSAMPKTIQLASLKLYETINSYAEWSN